MFSFSYHDIWKVSTVPKVSRWIDLVVVVPKVFLIVFLNVFFVWPWEWRPYQKHLCLYFFNCLLTFVLVPKVSGFWYLEDSDFAFTSVFAVCQIGIIVILQVRIFGGPDIYVREGSSLQLECVISQTIVSPKVSPNPRSHLESFKQKYWYLSRIFYSIYRYHHPNWQSQISVCCVGVQWGSGPWQQFHQGGFTSDWLHVSCHVECFLALTFLCSERTLTLPQMVTLVCICISFNVYAKFKFIYV